MRLKAIITTYRRDHEHRALQERRWFARQPSVEQAVVVAALARSPSGKRLSHQSRIPKAALERAHHSLSACLDRISLNNS